MNLHLLEFLWIRPRNPKISKKSSSFLQTHSLSAVETERCLFMTQSITRFRSSYRELKAHSHIYKQMCKHRHPQLKRQLIQNYPYFQSSTVRLMKGTLCLWIRSTQSLLRNYYSSQNFGSEILTETLKTAKYWCEYSTSTFIPHDAFITQIFTILNQGPL